MKDIVTIILAAGRGTRMKKNDGTNKVTTIFHGKPLIAWAVETALTYSNRVVVVVGNHEESVRRALSSYAVEYVRQPKSKGTAHATELATHFLLDHPPKYVVVGYGDHMMLYSPEIIKKFIHHHIFSSAVISLITAYFDKPNLLAYGRIVRTASGHVDRIVEQKDATDEEKKITEVNAGLYCFNFQFLHAHVGSIQASPLSGEHYLTDIVEIANKMGKKVFPYTIPFKEIGYGTNTVEDLAKSLKMKKPNH
ncbi:MAG: sugar phosphate nucleotidyltransferase [bacterium]